MTYSYKAPRAVNTATVALFYRSSIELLTYLGLRNPGSSAYPNCWCMPGGKLDAMGGDQAGETVEQCAIREVEEETNIRLQPEQLRILFVSSDPQTDPRGHFVNIVFSALVDEHQHGAAKPGSDLVQGDWFNYKQTYGKTMAFDHAELLGRAQRHMQGWGQ